ncbi:chemotaxis protein MotB [Rhodovulum imhoffii]|uniref:Chemotaxis protein MotB n=1 Tax=Rhodovulum imhoffii TaxID=365340 RepID=A0A2T5BRN4_9RHOB|nr:flagellar motor protein MotB [Rhodovulum imhoffii]MBK5934064.1 chemotaxis protein MotB [Rhodovulum imhoffii]PTN01949.1 chemotaxis protein MotB [Rhodovulum imhoffii]
MGAAVNAPVIIKRKKVVVEKSHYGGAWKVAYADFVTAMMAFFLLMWLLSATTEKQRKGIADYFDPTVPISRVSGGGDGAFGGESLASEDRLAQIGVGAVHTRPTADRQARGSTGTDSDGATQEETRALKDLADSLMGISGETLLDDRIRRHIMTRLTDEGLVIELFDIEGAPLFAPETSRPTPQTREIVTVLANLFLVVRNDIAIEGHVRAGPVILRHNPVWELSTQRAQTARQLLAEAGFPSSRLRRVTGHADRSPATGNPMALRNNRIKMILLRSSR